MDEEAFLERVRAAARAGEAHRVATRPLAEGTGYVGAAGDDLCAHFASEVTAVGGEAAVVGDRGAALATLEELLARYGARSALAWEHPALERLGLLAWLEQRGIRVQTHRSLAEKSADEQRAAILAADIGITSVSLAIAETGTLWMMSAPGQERVTSLVPPVHVAIVEESQLVPDLFDAFAPRVREGSDAMPSNITLITGPSKTGDIELQLTTGVHGPKHWHVIVIRGC